MVNRRSGSPIDEDTRRGGGEEDGNPLPPTLAEAQVSEYLKKERPRDRIKGTSNVRLEEHPRDLEVVEKSRLSDEQEKCKCRK